MQLSTPDPRPIDGGGRLSRSAARAVCLAVVALGWLAQPLAGQVLNAKIESIIRGAKVGDAQVGVSIVDLETGRVLAERNASTPMMPASNMKLLTTGTALAVLGDEFVFRTEVLLDGDRLIVRGAGDPALADPVMLGRMEPRLTVRDVLDTLAGAVRKAGVSRVSEIVVDDRVFDRTFVHQGWPADQLNRWYCAEVAGLNFHANVLSVFPRPSASGPGGTPSAAIEPEAPWVPVEIKARTVGTGRTAVWLSRDPTANRFTMYGEVRTALREPVEVTLHDPSLFAGRLMAASLLRAGVGVGAAEGVAGAEPSGDRLAAALAVVRVAGPEDPASAGRPVAAVTTHIRDIVERCNGDSQNLYAEALLKRVGHAVTGQPGSWANGGSVARMVLAERLGPEHAASTVVDDGSGLSRGNLVSPRTMTAWLDSLQRDAEIGAAFVASVPTPSKGNLRRRFEGAGLRNELRAKSGLIDGVRCLSGYLTDPQTGRRVAFSVLVNGLRPGEQSLNALKLHEEVVKVADRWLAEQRPATATNGREPALGG